jgi:hypothetical protein
MIFYCLKFETPPTWRSPYLYPPGTGWPSYTPSHWVPFSSPPTTRRATVEAFEPASTRGSIRSYLHGRLYSVAVTMEHVCWMFIDMEKRSILSWSLGINIRCCGNVCQFRSNALVSTNTIRCRGNAPSEPLSSSGRLLRCFFDCTLPAFRRHVTVFYIHYISVGICATAFMWSLSILTRTVPTSKIIVYCEILPYSLVELHWCSGGMYCLKTQAVPSSKTVINFYQTSKRNITEDINLIAAGNLTN